MHDPRYANKGRKAIDVPNVTLAVLRALAIPSTCVPNEAVMLSMATTHHMRLRPLQFSRVAHLDCFLSRLVSVCYGFTDSYGQCVYGSCNASLGLANPCLPSDYRRSQYVALNWAKWPLFIDTLRVARSALWLEADVVILTNPWPLLLSETEKFASVHDAIRYQFETPPCTMPEKVQSPAVACTKSDWPTPHPQPLNCGQLLLNSLQFALEVWSSRPAVFKNGEMSQQGYANIIKGNYSESGLPLGFFNHCWKAHRYAKVTDACQLQTYHATCEMVARNKRQAMNNSITGVTKHGCALASPTELTKGQLNAFVKRKKRPMRLSMQEA